MNKVITGRLFAFAMLGAIAIAPTAYAQSNEAAPNEPIVITESRPLNEDAALDVVRRAAQPVEGQLARFYAPVCPQVIGFDTPFEALVVEQIKETIRKVGVETGGDSCAPNLFVVIVDDGRDFVQELARQRPESLAGLSKDEVDALTGETGSARAWSLAVPTNSFGAVAGRAQSGTGGGAVNRGAGGSSVNFGGNVNVMRAYEASTVNPSVQQTITSSWVVIATDATLGKSLQQIADYAVMRGLAMVRPAELVGSADTILALFEPGATSAPQQLTGFDLAYLTSLYRVPARRWARSQVRYMAEAIARQSEQGTP